MQPQLQLGGTLIPSWHVYITRPADEQLFQALLNREFCSVLTSRQMGKSSLMMATARRLRAAGVNVATMDLAGDLGEAASQETAWRTIVEKIADELDIEHFDPDAWWKAQPEGTNNRKLLRFFRDVVGEAIPGPVVVFFDEIDSTLRLPYSDDLFTALRTIHNARASDETYARLTFCVVGVATPNELVKDQRTTAYNIGRTIVLRDFDETDDLSPLMPALHADEWQARALLERILYWTGGQPYLTVKFCSDLAGASVEDVDRYAKEKYSGLGELRREMHFEQMLRFLNERLTEGEAALAILERIIRGKPEPDRPTLAHAQLKLSGLVKETPSGTLVIRNRIYARLFDRTWLQSLAAKKKMRWLRRYAVAVSVVAVLAVAAVLYYRFSLLPRKVAEEYRNQLQAATLLRDAQRARDVLAGRRPDPGTGITLRGWEQEATTAYANVQERWVAVRMQRATAMMRRGDVEEALVLGAYIAQEIGGTLDPMFREEYEARGYGALLTTLRSRVPFAPGLAVSPDGGDIAVGNVWWRREGSRWRARTLGSDPGVNAVAFARGDVYTGDDAGRVHAWSIAADGRVRNRLVASLEQRVLDFAAGKAGELLVVVHSTGQTEKLRSEQAVQVLETGRLPVAATFSPDGEILAAATGPVVTTWRRGRVAGTFRAPGDSLFRDVAVAMDGTVAAAEAEAVLLLTRGMRAGREIPHQPPVRSIAYSSTKSLLATASGEGVRVFDEALHDLALRLGDPVTGNQRSETAHAVAFDEGNGLLVVRRRESIQIWRLSGGSGAIADRPLRDWERQFSLIVTPGEEVMPAVQ